MLNVIIADDEKGIIELIKHLIDPEKVNIRIVGEAYNGQEAFQLIQNKKPDVAITDIRMPGLTGIELIKKCKSESPETSFIIISGFQEFSYAQEALKYGVSDYLLKPIKRLALNEALMKLDQEKGVDAINKAEVQERRKILETNTRLLRRQAIDELVNRKKLGDSAIQLFYQNNVFVQDIGHYCIAVVKLIDTLHVMNAVSKETVDVLMERIVRCLESSCLDIEYVSYDSFGILYLHISPDSFSVEDEIKLLDRELYSGNFTYDFLALIVAFGKEVDTKEKLDESYRSALDILHSRINSESGGIFSCNNVKNTGRSSGRAYSPSEFQDLKKAIVQMDKENCTQIIRDLFEMQKMSFQSDLYLYQLASDIIETIYHECKTAFPDSNIEDPSVSLRMIDQAVFSVILEDICLQYAVSAIDDCSVLRDKIISKPVREMCRYMQENVKEQISLKDLATLVSLNQVYISNIFKKEMGISISTYFTNLKMDYAKELLRNTTMTVSMIAEEVGYQDARYFSKQFIRTVGIKPMDYRKFYV